MNNRITFVRGFSLVEMLVSVAVFTIVMAAVFGLLISSQQRYQADSELLDTFQDARQAMDLIVRDIHSAGYPPANSVGAAAAAANPQLIAFPFAWDPGYPAAPCTVGATCNVNGGPAGFDLIIESDVDPLAANGVEWIRYRLNGTTLERGVATKTAGANPANATQPTMVAYVENVMNNATAAQMAALQAAYPGAGLFPGNAPVPVFTYQFDAGVPATARAIRSVNITLIVQSRNPDPKTRQLRVVTLTGYARRVNP